MKYKLITKSDAIALNPTNNSPDMLDNIARDVAAFPAKVDVQALIDLKVRTHGRFDFDVEPNGKIANLRYVDYDFEASKIQQEEETGTFKTKPLVVKQVAVV